MSIPFVANGCPNAKGNVERSCPRGTYCQSFHKCQLDTRLLVIEASGFHYRPDLTNVDLEDGRIHRIT